MNHLSPTPYRDVNEIVNILLADAQKILDNQLLGMYLHGSLANGGFDKHSDIDIVFVTNEAVSEESFSALDIMHTELAKLDSPWARQLEVSYIPKNALRRFDRANITHPHLDRGSNETLHWMAHEVDWIIQRHILRERGIVVLGPAPKTLIDAVSSNDLQKAVVEGIHLWLHPILADPSEINRRGYQSFFVLSLCRMLYTLKHGKILSKQAAARWALENLNAHWKPLIERALIGRQNPALHAVPDDIQGTLDMMRFVLQQIKPTPYPDINEVLNVLLRHVKEILGNQFLGMYLYGSLASGDFNPETSDVDFLVVTTAYLSAEKSTELQAMHQRLWESDLKWAARLEGAYTPRDLIRCHDSNGAPCPTVNEGRYYLARLGSDWIIQRHIVRESGKAVEGPDPKALIDPVSPEDIRSAVRGVLEEWWFPMLEDPSWLAGHGSEYHAYAILTMCRALYALEHGTIISKPAAARWAQGELGEPWRHGIEHAISAQKPGEGKPELFRETLDLIRYTRSISNL